MSTQTSPIDPGPAVDASAPVTARQPRRRFRRVVWTCGIVALLFALVEGYDWWQQHRTEQFKAGCVAATNEEQWERLGLIAGKWLEWDPASDDARIYRAESEFQADRLDEAAALLGQVRDDYHGAVPALIFRGEILYGDLHRPYEAEQTWQHILRLDPQSTHAHQRLILFYALSIQRRRMTDQIRESLRRRCEPPEAYAYLIVANALGFTEGLTHVRNWRRSQPDDETLEVAEAIYTAKYAENPNVLDAYEESHFFAGDQTAVDACLEKYPQNVEVLAFQIEKQIFFGNTEDVVSLLKSAPAEAMEDSRFWRFRAWLFQQAEDHEQAIKALEKSIEIDPFGWRSRWELASLLRLDGRLAEAEQVQELALQGKVLQDELYRTDGRAMTWGLVQQMRDYIRRVGDAEVLAALDSRIRSQGGAGLIFEQSGTTVFPEDSQAPLGLPVPGQ
jgi:tetratricopeptide (TPR) repeat protein